MQEDESTTFAGVLSLFYVVTAKFASCGQKTKNSQLDTAQALASVSLFGQDLSVQVFPLSGYLHCLNPPPTYASWPRRMTGPSGAGTMLDGVWTRPFRRVAVWILQ